LSTGGFTDCLLQRGAKHVFGVDVGYGQAHEKIRASDHVTVKERTNLRNITLYDIGQKVDMVTLDLSFISLKKVIPAISRILKDKGILISLIKPQFEAERKDIQRGGIVKDPVVHERIIEDVTHYISNQGFILKGYTDSPIKGATGNKEFLAYFVKDEISRPQESDVQE
jgi:23S rRNA (cytidine1920-2'-O)/16S rRNA (cytidine1409-2'-O)-methyltransferase